MHIKDKLITENRMHDLQQQYSTDRCYDAIGSKTRARLYFIDFLLDSDAENIEYAIDYIRGTELYDVLFSIILEYRTYGISALRKEQPEETETTEELVEEPKKSFIGKFFDLFSFKDGSSFAIIFKKLK